MTQNRCRPLCALCTAILKSILPGMLLCYVWMAFLGPKAFAYVIRREVNGYPNLLGIKHITIANAVVGTGANIYPWLMSGPRPPADLRCESHSTTSIVTYDIFFGKRCEFSEVSSQVRFYDEPAMLMHVLMVSERATLSDLETVTGWGVDVNRVIFDGITLFQMAMCLDKVDVLELLMRHGLRLDSEQIFDGAECAAIRGSSHSIKWLIDSGYDLKAITESEQRISNNGDVAAILYIVPAHSNLLHIACIFGRTEIYEMLKTAGLDQELVNARGQTPRDMCARSPK